MKIVDILLVGDNNNTGFSIGEKYGEVLQDFISSHDYDFMNDMTNGETCAWHFRVEYESQKIKRVYLGYKLNEDDTLLSDDEDFTNPIIDIINSWDESANLDLSQRFILPNEFDDVEFRKNDIRVQLLKDDCDYSYFEAYLITSDELDDDYEDILDESNEFLDGYDDDSEFIDEDEYDDY